jgi:hypothetical protein
MRINDGCTGTSCKTAQATKKMESVGGKTLLAGSISVCITRFAQPSSELHARKQVELTAFLLA